MRQKRRLLTPTDERHYDNALGCHYSENDDQFLEHQHSFSTHPHHRSQSEVLDDQREDCAGNLILCPVNSN